MTWIRTPDGNALRPDHITALYTSANDSHIIALVDGTPIILEWVTDTNIRDRITQWIAIIEETLTGQHPA